jgi:hypothetical protein
MQWSDSFRLNEEVIENLPNDLSGIYRILLSESYVFNYVQSFIRKPFPKPSRVPSITKRKRKWELKDFAISPSNTKIVYIGQTEDLKRRLKEHLKQNECIGSLFNMEIPLEVQFVSIASAFLREAEKEELNNFCQKFQVCPPCNCKSPECYCQKIDTYAFGRLICKS